MHFSERITVPISAPDVWGFVWQVERMAACLPGCVGVTEVEAGRCYRARIEDRVGPYKLGFDLNVVIDDAEAPRRLHLTASGADATLGVTQRIAIEVTLSNVGANQTRVDLEADVDVQGKIAALGQFMIRRKAGDIVKQFARNVDAALRRAYPS